MRYFFTGPLYLRSRLSWVFRRLSCLVSKDHCMYQSPLIVVPETTIHWKQHRRCECCQKEWGHTKVSMSAALRVALDKEELDLEVRSIMYKKSMRIDLSVSKKKKG